MASNNNTGGGCVASFRGGPQLSPAQLAELAIGCGFADPVEAVAHALAESGGRYQAWCENRDGTRDRGLLQFNSKWFAYISDPEAYDPGCNMLHGARWVNGKGWGAWVADPAPHRQTAAAAVAAVRAAVAQGKTVAQPPTLDATGKPKPGTWRPGTAAGAAPVAGGGGPQGWDFPDPTPGFDIVPGWDPDIPNPLAPVTDGLSTIASMATRLFDPAFWRRVGFVLAAVALAWIAVAVILRETAAPAVLDVVGSTPQGAAVKSAAAAAD